MTQITQRLRDFGFDGSLPAFGFGLLTALPLAAQAQAAAGAWTTAGLSATPRTRSRDAATSASGLPTSRQYADSIDPAVFGLTSYVSPLDTEGNRLVLLARVTPQGRLNVFHVVVGDLTGLSNFELPSFISTASYITGGRLMEETIAERARQLGDGFTLRRVMDEINAAGMIPVSLIYWEVTGDRRFMRYRGGPMLIEAVISRRNEARLRAQGAEEPPDDVYRVMQVSYPAAFALMLTEGALDIVVIVRRPLGERKASDILGEFRRALPRCRPTRRRYHLNQWTRYRRTR